MYGWLTFDENRTLTLNYPDWDFTSSPVLNPEALAARRNKSLLAVTAAFPAAGDIATKEAAFFALSSALRHITDDHVDYCIAVGVAFYQLHRNDFKDVQAQIAQLVDLEFGTVPKDADPAMGDMVKRLKEVGFLLPTLSQKLIFNGFCSRLRATVLERQNTNGLELLAQSLVLAYVGIQRRLHVDAQEAAKVVANAAMISSNTSELQAVFTSNHTLLEAARSDVFLVLHQRYTSSPLSGPAKGLALQNCLKCAAQEPRLPIADIADIADRLFSEALAWDRTEDGFITRTSIAAIDSGVNIGPRTQSSRAVLQQVRANLASRQQQQLQALVNEARSRRSGKDSPAPSGHDRDTLHTWSVDRLVRWIDGPMAGPRRKALNHSKAVEQSKGMLPAAVAGGTPRKPVPDLPTVTENDVVDIAAHAYGVTAQFFLGDLHDLILLGKRLGAAAPLLATCASVASDLDQLAQAPLKFGEKQAQDLLTKAEEAIEQLRDALKRVQSKAALEQRFLARLMVALAQETFTPGRRQGGVIACPLAFDDWAWVSARFHRRWLPSARHVVVAGARVPLEVNEALALYVTASSESGHAFDISVHLWRRDGSSTDLPSKGTELFPAMNAESWFDTYTTCCVLHIPLKG